MVQNHADFTLLSYNFKCDIWSPNELRKWHQNVTLWVSEVTKEQ